MIGISETKHIDGHNLTTNVSMEGYSLYSQPTKSSYGGVALYVNEKLDNFCRNGLGPSKKNLFETIWVEIKQKKAKIFSVAVHTDIMTQMWMNLRITLRSLSKNF